MTVALRPSDRQLMNRALWRIMPLTILCSVIGTIDRTNIGFAKLGMRTDIGVTEAAFAFGSSLFYLGYVLFEVPSSMGNARFGARLWLSRIMITWSVVTLLLAFTTSTQMFYLLRFALGVAEAGIYPAQLYYVTLWFPQSERPRAIGILTLGSAFGNGFSALLCGSLLDLGGVAGLSGWQWIFLVTGALPIFATILVLRYLPDNPMKARFFSDEEKLRVASLLEQAAPQGMAAGHTWDAIFNRKVLGFGVLYAIILGSLYGVIYWAPTVFAEFHLTGTANGLLVAVPWAFDAVLLMLVSARLRTNRAVLIAMSIFAFLGVVSFAVGALSEALEMKALALLFGIPATSLCIGFFWTLPVRHFSGPRSAAAIGAVSTIGNVGGIAALNLMPEIARIGGSPSTALWYPSIGMIGILSFAALSLLALNRSMVSTRDALTREP
jgi:MFS family permease